MSTITDALKRAASRAAHEPAGGLQPPAADDRFPEALPAAAPLPRPEAAPVLETAAPQDGADRRQRLLLWGAVAVAAVVLVGLLYSRLGRVVETPSAQAGPNVWREKIIDEREALLAELNLPEERLDDEGGGEAAAPEAPTPEAVQPEAKQPVAAPAKARRQAVPPAPKPAARAPQRTAKLALADDDDEEAEDEDEEVVRAAPAPRRAAPAAPRQVANPTAPASPIAPGFRPQPTTGPLPANQFAYNAPAARVLPVTATPAQPVQPPDPTTELYRHGLESEKAGRTEHAIALYRLVLDKQPGREAVSLRLGNLLHRQGQLDEAAKVFRQAVAAKDSAVLRNNLGGVFLAQKKLEEARAEFSAAAALDPKYADPHYNLACYHALAGRPQEGLAELEKAKALDPKVMESAATDHDLAALRALPEYKRLTE